MGSFPSAVPEQSEGHVPPGGQDVVGEGQLPVDELSLGVKVEGVSVVQVQLAFRLALRRKNESKASGLRRGPRQP